MADDRRRRPVRDAVQRQVVDGLVRGVHRDGIGGDTPIGPCDRRTHEIAGHALCFAVGLIVFLVFVLKAGPPYRAYTLGNDRSPDVIAAYCTWNVMP